MEFLAVVNKQKYEVSVEKCDDLLHIRCGEDTWMVDAMTVDEGLYSLLINGKSFEVAVREDKKGAVVEVDGQMVPVRLEDLFSSMGVSGPETVEGEVVVESPMPGRVVGIKKTVGDSVQEGEGVVVVEAMKMENELESPKSGVIREICVSIGDTVESGQKLVVIE